MMKKGMAVTKVNYHDDGTNLIVDIEVNNPSNRTLHVYASPRKMLYDPGTKTLKVQLSDRDLDPSLLRGSFVLPKFSSVDPHAQTVITLKLPRNLTRFAAGQNQLTPKIEVIPIHEAQTVELDVAWSDTPFYDDSREGRGHLSQQLTAWSKADARGRGSRREPTPEKK